jgi:hypothetical protein
VEQKNRTLVEMARTMLYEHMTPTCFWADAISIACYISNRIFLRTILNLTPFGFALDASRMALISCLFGCKCFVLNRESLDKFESRSSDGILLVYTPHGRLFRSEPLIHSFTFRSSFLYKRLYRSESLVHSFGFGSSYLYEIV